MRKNVEHYKVFCINYYESRGKFGPSSQLILFTFCENEVLAVVVAGMMVVTVVVVGEVSRSLFGMSRRSGYCVVS